MVYICKSIDTLWKFWVYNVLMSYGKKINQLCSIWIHKVNQIGILAHRICHIHLQLSHDDTYKIFKMHNIFERSEDAPLQQVHTQFIYIA